MTNLKIVLEAQERIDWQINYWRDGDDIKDIHDQRNSWLAHKAFFERHGGKLQRLNPFNDDMGLMCQMCDEFTPCPELVAQAKAIMGVTE